MPGILRAREMGLRVVLTDGSEDCPGRAHANVFCSASTYDPDGTIAALKSTGETLDGVICIATDVPLTVATVAEAFGLPGIGVDSARAAADKLEMKNRLARGGVKVPRFWPIGSDRELDDLRMRSDVPLILKPVDSRGARGVIRLLPNIDSAWAFGEAHKHSPTGRVMAEAFLVGPQLSTESLVVDGRVFTVGIADRNYERIERFAPFMVEDGGDTPADLDPATHRDVLSLIERSAAALGIQNGVVKGDVVLHGGAPHVIEVAARLSGGYFCTHQIPLATGVDLVGAAILVAIGQEPPAEVLRPSRSTYVAQRFVFPSPGRVVRISGIEDVVASSGVELCEVRVGIGDRIAAVESHPMRAGLVITTGASRQEARARAEGAVEALRIETVPR